MALTGDIAPNKKQILEAMRVMQRMPEFSIVSDALAKAIQITEQSSAETGGELQELFEPRVLRALRLYFAGYLPEPPAPVPQTSMSGDGRPDDTSGKASLSAPPRLPDKATLIAALRDESESITEIAKPALNVESPNAEPVGSGKGVPKARATDVTFLFLADPQIWAGEKTAITPRTKTLNEMNKVLNKISSQTWPTGKNLDPAIVGTKIDKPVATFFGGDLCQTGGGYNFGDQFFLMPWAYKGGFELEVVRQLFDENFESSGLTKLNAGNIYFGLGNHDVQS